MASQIELQNAARHVMWDVSTSHLTKEDAEKLREGRFDGLPRTIPHEYGGIVFLDSGWVSMVDAAAELRRRGMSESFVELYLTACRDKAALLINFDRDAQVLPGIPTFEW
jgi:hypothetical protein